MLWVLLLAVAAAAETPQLAARSERLGGLEVTDVVTTPEGVGTTARIVGRFARGMLVEQVEFPPRAQEQVGVATLPQAADDGRADHAAMASDVDAGVGSGDRGVGHRLRRRSAAVGHPD